MSGTSLRPCCRLMFYNYSYNRNDKALKIKFLPLDAYNPVDFFSVATIQMRSCVIELLEIIFINNPCI